MPGIEGNAHNYDHHEIPDPCVLSVEEMQTRLTETGWTFRPAQMQPPETGGPPLPGKLERHYPRINDALDGYNWRQAISEYPAAMAEAMPDERRGFAVGTEADELEVTVSLFADPSERWDFEKVYVMDAHLRARGFEDIDPVRRDEWLQLKDATEQGLGTKEYYERDPRAAELRELSLQAIDDYAAVALREGMDGSAMGRLLDANRRLAELDVSADTHVGARPVELIEPAKRAEWIAGQVRSALQAGYGFSGDAEQVIRDNSTQTGDFGLSVTSQPEALQAMYLLDGLLMLREKLGVDPTEG
jgi:hypothetical protein